MQSTDRSIGWAYVSPLRRERIEAGVKALERIDKHVTFYDWRLVGEALADLREAAKDQSGANGYIGKGYNAAWARCVADNPDLVPLSKLDTATRTNAMWLAEHWDTVAEWHAGLEDSVRRLVNHPATVRRRFTQDHPLPVKSRKAGALDLEPEDEAGELEDEGEVYDLGAGDSDTVTEADTPGTIEDWIRAFEELWRRMPAAVRRAIAQRIVQWQIETMTHAALEEPVEVDLIDEAEAEIALAVAKDAGAKVRAQAYRRSSTSISSEPQPERLAMVVEEALAKPVVEGEDVFAGLGDNLRPGVLISAVAVRARRPSLARVHAEIIAARLNFSDFNDQQIAKYVGKGQTVERVRRVLDANGFKRR